MYETDGRGGMIWDSLEPGERKLAKIAFWASLAPTALLLVPIARDGYALGQWLKLGPGKSNGQQQFMTALEASPWFGAFVAFAIVSAIVAGVAWWRFSQKQDELFHRIQSHTLGRTAAVGLALILLLWALSLPGWVKAFPLEQVVVLEILLFACFSGDAYRRWG